MLSRLDASYADQARFVSDASHELRTPIAVIQGYANILSRWGTEDPETLRESIEAIKSEAESMKQLVNQLLFLARGDSESMQLDWKSLDMSQLIAEAIREELMIDMAHQYKTTLAEEIFIEGDAGLIKQLFRIIADNSIKYTPAGGRIDIRLYKNADDNVILEIQDDGIGIPADVLPHIFDRFVRAEASRARNTGGAGLGLSIALWITERHGGHLEVLSREGIGTRFTAVLPTPKSFQ
jgi:signal transduction histidine kinase